MPSRFAYPLFALVTAALLSVSAGAQVLEYDLPESFEILPGRLAVTFSDTVRMEDALSLLSGLPLDSIQVEFYPILVAAQWVSGPRTRDLDTLITRPFVRSVLSGGAFLEATPDVAYVRDRAPDLARNPLAGLAVLLEPHAPADAVAAVAAGSDSYQVDRIDRRPNEILLFFDPATEEAVVGHLDTSPLVEYLSYVAGP